MIEGFATTWEKYSKGKYYTPYSIILSWKRIEKSRQQILRSLIVTANASCEKPLITMN